MNPDCMPDKHNAARAEWEDYLHEGNEAFAKEYYEWSMDEMAKQRLTAEQRAEFARERQALVGSLITQKGWEGALVKEHVRGSQYVVLLPDGTQVYASHKKPRARRVGLSEGGWSKWEDRR